MASRSLRIVNADTPTPAEKKRRSAPKAAPKKRAVIINKTKAAKAEPLTTFQHAELTEKERVVLPVVQKKTVQKKTAPKSRAKKSKPAKAAVVSDSETTHDHLPYSWVAADPKAAPMTGIKRHPLGHLLLEKKLREAGFVGGISSHKSVLEKYSTDESIFSIQPQVVIQPKHARDVEIATKLIAEETKRFTSLSLTPRAAGTGLSGGALTDSIVIDVSAHLTKIGEVKEHGDHITITCEPGAMWRDVERRLARHHAYLPSYTSSKDICSIGGSIGNNSAGPDSLRYGHCADWVESLDVVLSDGNTYTVTPLSFKDFKVLTKQKHRYATIAQSVYDLIEQHESLIKKGKPKTPKNTAGYALWDVCPQGLAAWKKGRGTFDLTRLVSGSQGTVGVITKITMRALPIQEHTSLIVVPIFKLEDAAGVITRALKFNPINLEIFDALTFDLTLKNPDFFKQRLSGMDYYRTMLAMYTTYHVRYGRRSPEFTLLITVDRETVDAHGMPDILSDVAVPGVRARHVRNPLEVEMFLQIRRASFSLSKLLDPQKRPAAFLEDMTVPPENLSKFIVEIKRLFKEFNVQSAIHGHGGNGHFHFYPLLDFTQKTTPLLVEKMAEKFFATAIKYKGNICGEHNDGIIRTPHLSKMFKKEMIELFEQVEHLFDPDDIFNPGKKVHPRFDIKQSMRKTN